jgi:serine/threonine-protein kinase RsbW
VESSINGNGRLVRLTIPAKAEYIMLGRLALTSLSRVRELSDEELSDLKLALTEACTNAVQHAYGDQDGVVEIRYELHADRIVVEVSDNGSGFAPPVEAPTADDGLSEGGLGIAIIRALSDEFEIGERAGGGSTLRFVKLLAR